jgi:hypothetical protein
MNQEPERELELERLAGRLGARAAERLDVERTTVAVVERLRSDRTDRGTRWISLVWLRAAALIVLMVGAGLVVKGRLTPRASAADHYVREELQDLSADQLREVLGSLDQTLNDGTLEPAEDDFGDLTAEQLRALLQSLEG